METRNVFIDPSEDSLHSQLDDQTSRIQPGNCLTDQELLNLFENRELVTYYVGLKEALAQWRCTEEPCLCDPRDTDMRLRLGQWQPKIVLKLAHEQKSSTSAGVELASKQLALVDNRQSEDPEEESTVTSGSGSITSSNSQGFLCGLSGCKQVFQSLASYESHYHTCHNFVCCQCKSSLVSSFLLDIHLQENHDSYFQVLSLRSDMYRCLVECCDLKFKTPELRRDHMVQVHKLPANFMFHKPIITKPKKSRLKVKLAHGKDSMDTSDTISSTFSSTVEESAMEDYVSGRTPAAHASGQVTSAGASKDSRYKKLRSKPDISDSGSRFVNPVMDPSLCPNTPPAFPSVLSETDWHLSSEMVTAAESSKQSPRHRVPPVICFGRGSHKTFRNPRRPHWHQTGVTSMDTTTNIEDVDLSQLLDSLS